MGRHKGHTVDDYIRLAAGGASMAEAAAILKVAPQTVFVMASKHGIVFAKGKRGRKAKTPSPSDKSVD